MFVVSYDVLSAGGRRDWRRKSFPDFVSAQIYFLQKLKENRPGLRLSVRPDSVEED